MTASRVSIERGTSEERSEMTASRVSIERGTSEERYR
jgi:hypothetical protein